MARQATDRLCGAAGNAPTHADGSDRLTTLHHHYAQPTRDTPPTDKPFFSGFLGVHVRSPDLLDVHLTGGIIVSPL